jgi:hypothetical protein
MLCVLQVLGSIMQVFLAEPLGEWQQERKALSQLASLADAAAAGAASSGSNSAGGSAAAAAADQQGADVADLKVGTRQHRQHTNLRFLRFWNSLLSIWARHLEQNYHIVPEALTVLRSVSCMWLP